MDEQVRRGLTVAPYQQVGGAVEAQVEDRGPVEDFHLLNRRHAWAHEKTAAIQAKDGGRGESARRGAGIGVYFFEMFQNSVTGALITPWRLSR